MSQPIEAFRNSFKIPELRQRIIFTLVMVAVYRLGAHVPTPGVDGQALAQVIGEMGGLLTFYDMFSGGAFANATIFALGIMPYISASIIMSLLVAVIPALETLQKAGAEGQKKITEYTRYGTIGLCIVQSIMVASFLKQLNAGDTPILMSQGFGFYFMCVVSFTTGTAFIMWLGEQISEFGLGNGMSLIIFASIISSMPGATITVVNLLQQGDLNFFKVGVMIIVFVLVVGGIILVTVGQRRVPVQYPRQVKGRHVTAGGRNYLPLRVNQAGVIPIIFASSLLMIPSMIGSSINVPFIQKIFNDWFAYGTAPYGAAFAVLIIFFSFFYTAITFNPVEIADNMKKYGGVIMGIR
ncbi:MAG: preprotein translocase subunit SecY, partial [Candidatus Hydrogenedentota bacterium]